MPCRTSPWSGRKYIVFRIFNFFSQSCWIVNLCLHIKSFSSSNMFSSKMALYVSASIYLSPLPSSPVPAKEKQLYSMMLLSPCFRGGMVSSALCSALVLQLSASRLNSQILVSSEQLLPHVCSVPYMVCD
ncbi:hypothetical protein AMECASPLE_031378 [Ameca splendens]|uniref:Uncharacterized protein n=1 Tax=Ameca splendens TaxID=208324 RepID=A0ABV0YTJ2_9TELE